MSLNKTHHKKGEVLHLPLHYAYLVETHKNTKMKLKPTRLVHYLAILCFMALFCWQTYVSINKYLENKTSYHINLKVINCNYIKYTNANQ